MATYTSDQAAASYPVPGPQVSGMVYSAVGIFNVATALAQNDIVKMCKVPAGATVIGGQFIADDIDTGTEALDLDIGWPANGGSGTWDGADSDGFGNLGVLTGDASTAPNLSNVTGTIIPLMGILADGQFPTFTKETTIQLLCNAAANAGGTGYVSLRVDYVFLPTVD